MPNPLIKPNIKPPTSAEEPRYNAAVDEANQIVKKNSIIESFFGPSNDERIALRDALFYALLNRPDKPVRKNLFPPQSGSFYPNDLDDMYFSRVARLAQRPQLFEPPNQPFDEFLQTNEMLTNLSPANRRKTGAP